MELPQKQRFNSQWPSLAQWRQLSCVLSPREKVILPFLGALLVFSLFSLAQSLYISNTVPVPTKGGSIKEGVVGTPRFLNPLYADTNDVDRDLIQLIYSGMLRFNAQGELVPDLAASLPEIQEGGRMITLRLKENVQWHDGEPFTAHDVVFTIGAIKDPAYQSPIRANWLGVDVEEISDYVVRFYLLDPYAPFLERLTLKILPAHLWQNIAPEEFTLTPLNLQPVGTGPYRIARIQQSRSLSGQEVRVKEIQLRAFEGYHNPGPLIESFSFRFFKTEDELIDQATQGKLQTFSLSSIRSIQKMGNPVFSLYSFALPRYFALFFNLEDGGEQSALQERTVREALNLATDRKELIKRVFQDKARIVSSPFLPDIFGFEPPETSATADQQQALELLQRAGYVLQKGKVGKPQFSQEALTGDLERGDKGEEVRHLQQCLAQDPTLYPEGTINGNFGPSTQQAVIQFQERYASEVLTPLGLQKGTGKVGPLTREKLNMLCFTGDQQLTPLAIAITVPDYSPLKETAEELKRQWETLGIQVQLHELPLSTLQTKAIKPRAYEALLFGQVLGTIPDPLPFWHSSQSKTPGLNLSAYSNRAVDRLLEEIRKEFDPLKRKELFLQLQELVLTDMPALFLYDIDYAYFATKTIQGIKPSIISDPSQRFAEITQWYIKTKRVMK